MKNITIRLTEDEWVSVYEAACRGLRAYDDDYHNVIITATELEFDKKVMEALRPKLDELKKKTHKARISLGRFKGRYDAYFFLQRKMKESGS